MDVKIIGTDISKDHEKDKRHVNYVIRVTAGALSGHSWTVSRRYQRFEQLHSQLVALEGKSALPGLPASSRRRTFEREYVEKQQTLLEAYLEQLSQIEEVRKSGPWCEFLVSTFDQVLVNWDEDTERKHRVVLEQAMLQVEQRETMMAQIGRHQEQVAELKRETEDLRSALAKCVSDCQSYRIRAEGPEGAARAAAEAEALRQKDNELLAATMAVEQRGASELKEAKDTYERKLEELTAQLAAMTSDRAQIQERFNALEVSHATLATRLSESDQALASTRDQLTQTEKRADHSDQSINKQRAKSLLQKKDLSQLTEKNRLLTEQISQFESEIAKLKEKLESNEKEKEREKELEKKKLEELERKYEDLLALRSNLETKCNEKSKENEEWKEKYDQIERELNRCREEVEKGKSKEDEQRREREKADAERAAEKERMEEEMATLRRLHEEAMNRERQKFNEMCSRLTTSAEGGSVDVGEFADSPFGSLHQAMLRARTTHASEQAHAQDRIRVLEQENASLGKKASSAEEAVAELSRKYETSEEERRKLEREEEELREFTRVLTNLPPEGLVEDEIQRWERRLSQSKNPKAAVYLKGVRSMMEQKQRSEDQLRVSIKELEAQKLEIEKQKAALASERKRMEGELVALQSAVESERAKITAKEAELKALSAKEIGLEAEVGSLKKKVQQAEERSGGSVEEDAELKEMTDYLQGIRAGAVAGEIEKWDELSRAAKRRHFASAFGDMKVLVETKSKSETELRERIDELKRQQEELLARHREQYALGREKDRQLRELATCLQEMAAIPKKGSVSNLKGQWEEKNKQERWASYFQGKPIAGDKVTGMIEKALQLSEKLTALRPDEDDDGGARAVAEDFKDKDDLSLVRAYNDTKLMLTRLEKELERRRLLDHQVGAKVVAARPEMG